jgi:5-enolpyruvylshikimate-3-phosphate synthase
MSAAVLALGCSGKSVITDYKAVDKSYPTFFDDFNGVGGKAYEL